ncbi:MAG TPA: magnesium transporter [Candidatus Nanoarchaeia archaeon]|nr:magnesium transporter [Candidatus Nanoarchaeia archaeon]
MHIIDKNFKEIFSSQFISIISGLLVGTLIALYIDKLLLIPGMLILLPGFLEMRGNISGSLSARISSGLFLKVINPEKSNSRIVRGNITASFLLVLLVTFSIGILTYAFNLILFNISEPSIIFLPVIAGIIANIIQIPLTLAATFYLFKKGHDPNNIMGPFLTSTGDVISIAALLIALIII